MGATSSELPRSERGSASGSLQNSTSSFAKAATGDSKRDGEGPEVGTVTEKRDRFREGDDGDGNDGSVRSFSEGWLRYYSPRRLEILSKE